MATLIPIMNSAGAGFVDLSDAAIVRNKDPDQLGKKAITVLREEIRKRTSVELGVMEKWPDEPIPVIAVGQRERLDEVAGPMASILREMPSPGKEGYNLRVKKSPREAAVVLGRDPQGVLYGIGRLLRKMKLDEGSILAPKGLRLTTSPQYSLRGHQLGYRPKTNAYDAWTPEQYDQYIRELALFGANAIEIVPPRTDDERVSKHMPIPPMEMMVRLSEIIDSYGMEVWIWYPNMGEDYRRETVIQDELAERDRIFRQLERIDHVFIPGGDPGDLHPDQLFPWMKRVAGVLNEHHPDADIWVSPQAMEPTREWLAAFYAHANETPDWLGGLVFGPWIKTPIARMRQIVDNDLPIRRYPDITHNVACQYPVRNWDLAFALTLHRECYNPRPLAMDTIHDRFDEYAVGALTYTEGINDDVNKFIWSDQNWDPETPPIETLRDYARLFISPKYSDPIAQGLIALEENWDGPLASNDQVDVTLQQWREMEQTAPARVTQNYRFQMGLLRAYYDAYIKRRLIYETGLEDKAVNALRRASKLAPNEALHAAETLLVKSERKPVAQSQKRRCEQLADSLFEKIGSQLTVEEHGAKHRTRGAFMDGIDEPLNNKNWLLHRFELIRQESSREKQLAMINDVVNRTNPGPGGFYDNMGSHAGMDRIVNDVPWKEDPGSLKSPRIAFYYRVDRSEDKNIPLAWKNQVGTIYETPLTLAYDHLDPGAGYTVRIAYTGRRGDRVRLVADHKYLIHGLIETREPPIREFEVPEAATRDGELSLTWTCGDGERGSQVAEIWLIRE